MLPHFYAFFSGLYRFEVYWIYAIASSKKVQRIPTKDQPSNIDSSQKAISLSLPSHSPYSKMRLPPSPLSSGQSSPILPVHFPTPTRIRNYKNIAVISVFATLAILLVVQGGRSEVAGDYLERIRGAVEARVGEECPIEEDFGGDEGEVGRPTKLVVRVRPEGRHSTTTHPANQLSNVQFHPTLSSQFPKFFPTANIAPSPSSLVEQSIEGEEKCGEEGRIIHTLPILPPPFLRPGESNLFFSICTSPERVIEFAQPIWSHFLSTPLTPSQAPSSIMRKLWSDKPSSPPGCLIVDARGQENSLMERANEVLGEAGTGCVMRDSSRVGERYEMRVLGLVNDAWEESERRRKNHSVDGGIVEWFVFGYVFFVLFFHISFADQWGG